MTFFTKVFSISDLISVACLTAIRACRNFSFSRRNRGLFFCVCICNRLFSFIIMRLIITVSAPSARTNKTQVRWPTDDRHDWIQAGAQRVRERTEPTPRVNERTNPLIRPDKYRHVFQTDTERTEKNTRGALTVKSPFH